MAEIEAWHTWFVLYKLCDGDVKRCTDYCGVKKAYRRLKMAAHEIKHPRPPTPADYRRMVWNSRIPGQIVITEIYEHFQQLMESGTCASEVIDNASNVRFYSPENPATDSA